MTNRDSSFLTSETLPESFLRTVSIYADAPAYGTKIDGKFKTICWAEVAEKVRQSCGGLVDLGMNKGDRVAILSANRLEWVIADMGALFAGLVVVPIYPSLLPSQVKKVMVDCEARLVFVSDPEQLAKILEIKDQLPNLEQIVMFSSKSPDDEVKSLQDLLEHGANWNVKNPGKADTLAASHKGDDVFTLIYTSGTTGDQKGVMLSHRNLLNNIRGAIEKFPISEKDTFLSHLPLSHVFERMAGYYFPLCLGCCVYYAEDITTVGADLPVASPTIMVSVPRLFEKIQARILENAERGPKLKYGIFKWAVNVGKSVARRKMAGKTAGALLAFQHRIADKLVFGKIREKTGGQLRFAISGGAPLRRDLGEFFLAVDLLVIEGYGLTETSPVIAANNLDEFKFGSVGKAFPGVEIKIAVDGEILVKGDSVMQGYYNRPQETCATIKDGWLHTGDIGHFDNEDYLVITDRKKNIIVTSGGKNIAPQPIEAQLQTSSYIEQIMIIGEKRNYISALIVPNFEMFRVELGLDEQSPPPTTDKIAEHPEVFKIIDSEIQRLSTDLAQFERVRKFSLLGNEFCIESGELTPSLKIKRGYILEKYNSIIEGMYLTSDHKDRKKN
jgi:long-chain acyl-CoA synthetase